MVLEFIREQVEVWGPFWSVVVAFCTVMATVGFGRWGWPIVKRVGQGLGDFCRGLLAIAELPKALPTLSRLVVLEETVCKIHKEVIPNGGSSLRDAVNLTRDGVKRTEVAMALFVNSTRAQWDGMGLFAVFETDADGMLNYVNSTYQRWALRPERDLLQAGWIVSVAPHDRDRVRREWESCVDDSREFVCTYDMRDATGRETRVLSTAVPVTAMRQGPVMKWVGVIRHHNDIHQGGH